MTHNSREVLRLATSLPTFVILLLALLQTSQSTGNDYHLFDVSARVSPSPVSENTLRHIMQLVSLGTGLRVPSPIGFRYREKALKRARMSSPNSRHPELVLGSEFLGKRSSDDKRMGSEFLGKRMGSEFLGKRMGSEFLGKRMGSEFLGKRMGSEFLGKRMGSEFLGKRMGSEFLGKRTDPGYLDEASDDPSADKRVGSEFLGKRGDEYEYKEDSDIQQTPSSVEGPDSIDSVPSFVFSEEEKRVGSEFLGRKRREAKTPESQA